MVAIAGRCNIYVINNKLYVKQIKIDLNKSSGIMDMDNMYKEPQISLEPLVKTVTVKYYTDLETSLETICTNSVVKSGDSLKVEDNTLISSIDIAKDVGNWIIGIKNLRANYEANWRQNPSMDLLDVIDIENAYETNKAIITKQEYEYQGYLKGKTKLIGGINIVN